MRIVCLCMVIGFLVSGCTTTKKVDLMIDSSVAPQFAQVDAQFKAHEAAATETLEDMKVFVDRLGRRLDKDVKDLQADANALDTKISKLQSNSGATQKEIAAAKADLAKLDGSIAPLSDKIDALKAGITALEASDAKQADAQKANAAAAAANATKLAEPKGLFHKHNK